jgi:hypothetical protein
VCWCGHDAEFYLRAVTGRGLDEALTDGKGHRGGVKGGREVQFESKLVRQYARETAGDELARGVPAQRAREGSRRPAGDRPRRELHRRGPGRGPHQGGEVFDPYADENNILLGAFIFEDVGVTAYKGAAPLLSNRAFIEAAAGILATEAYHAATIRTVLLGRGLGEATVAISDARDFLDGPNENDQGALLDGEANITPVDENAIVFGRTTREVLNVVYLTPEKADEGGFFPRGVNGAADTSSDAYDD